MIGPIDFTVTTKKYVFEIHLQRNVTVIRGDGATYKSLFCKYIEEAGLVGHGVHLHPSTLRVAHIRDKEFYIDHLSSYKGTQSVLVFDEDALCIKSKEFRKAIEDTGCYFILITRHNCSEFGVSTKEIYRFVHHEEGALNKCTITMQALVDQTHFFS